MVVKIVYQVEKLDNNNKLLVVISHYSFVRMFKNWIALFEATLTVLTRSTITKMTEHLAIN